MTNFFNNLPLPEELKNVLGAEVAEADIIGGGGGGGGSPTGLYLGIGSNITWDNDYPEVIFLAPASAGFTIDATGADVTKSWVLTNVTLNSINVTTSIGTNPVNPGVTVRLIAIDLGGGPQIVFFPYASTSVGSPLTRSFYAPTLVSTGNFIVTNNGSVTQWSTNTSAMDVISISLGVQIERTNTSPLAGAIQLTTQNQTLLVGGTAGVQYATPASDPTNFPNFFCSSGGVPANNTVAWTIGADAGLVGQTLDLTLVADIHGA